MSDYWQFTVKGKLMSQETRNVFYFVGGGVDTNQQNVVDYLRQSWNAYLKTALVDNFQIYAVDVRDVGVAGLPRIEYAFTSGPLTMDNTGVPLPAQTACHVVFGANVARPNKTRKFLCGMQYGALDTAGLWSSSFVSTVSSWAANILDITSTYTGIALGCVSWDATRSYVTGANLPDYYVVDSNPSTQRRRRQGVGI